MLPYSKGTQLSVTTLKYREILDHYTVYLELAQGYTGQLYFKTIQTQKERPDFLSEVGWGELDEGGQRYKTSVMRKRSTRGVMHTQQIQLTLLQVMYERC